MIIPSRWLSLGKLKPRLSKPILLPSTGSGSGFPMAVFQQAQYLIVEANLTPLDRLRDL